MRPFFRLFLPMLLSCFSAGCLLPISSSLQDSPKDPVISSEMSKRSLPKINKARLSGIIVTTEDGMMTLIGTVAEGRA